MAAPTAMAQDPPAAITEALAHESADWGKSHSVHSPRMVMDESGMPRGAALLAGMAERFLATGRD